MPVTVIKRDAAGAPLWQYTGEALERGENFVRLRALFDRPDRPFVDTVLRRGDVFLETFYTDRWYNVFEIRDRDDGALKGWYCNLGRPAVWEAPDLISYEDLALDLWVSPAGQQTVLDEDEFAALNLDEKTRRMVSAALRELQGMPWVQFL
ncbi:MAG: hypothetical protein Fur0035_02570 [Anaerolineales bacterium]